ncbi:MAG: acyl transferase [Bacteroidota bacterium]
MQIKRLEEDIFHIATQGDFNRLALEIFHFQYQNNEVYRHFCRALHADPEDVTHYSLIPFLPIEFFKTHKVISGSEVPSLVFSSSGTTGMQTSRHYVKNPELYRKSFVKAFRIFFGNPQDYHILALLPGYLERKDSSLVYMAQELIRLSNSSWSGFYLDQVRQLQETVHHLAADARKVLLLGVSFALLDMAGEYPVSHPRLTIMETGGMKGRRKEMVRQKLHDILKKAFHVEHICSEYGMTELLSQAYSTGDGTFSTPPWMKVMIRETHDPLSYCAPGVSGGINIIDLANIHSCSFIATQDLGKVFDNGTFAVTGRFDSSDTRGCNLMVS